MKHQIFIPFLFLFASSFGQEVEILKKLLSLNQLAIPVLSFLARTATLKILFLLALFERLVKTKKQVFQNCISN